MAYHENARHYFRFSTELRKNQVMSVKKLEKSREEPGFLYKNKTRSE
jgi:hypothetical protein